jgi:PPOX class probable F420-dependent enzyme
MDDPDVDAPATFEPGAERYVSLATFRRDGTEVRTPVWTARVDGRCFVFTATDAGKVKRVRANGRARVAPCDLRGRVHGPWREMHGRIVADAALEARVHRAFRRKYGWQMWLTDLASRLTGRISRRAVIELLPAPGA